MATGKKFYWIKLRTSFLDSEKIDFLLSQKNGANYVVIYQMLCLKTINTEVEGTKLVVLCNLCEEENKVVWQSEWDSYELLLGNYSDGKVDGTLRPYECKVMRSI